MMDVGDGMTLLMFPLLFATLIVKILNVMSAGRFYERMWSFATFILSGLCYLLIFLTAIAKHTLIYAMYLNVATFVFMLTFVLFVVEILMMIVPRRGRLLRRGI